LILRYVPLILWLLLGCYGIVIQTLALRYALRASAIAKHFGDLSSVNIMALGRLRTNYVRLSVVCVNLGIGLLSVLNIVALHVSPVTTPTIISVIITMGFIGNEVAMVWISTAEVRMHRALRRRTLAALNNDEVPF
jgi:hypothetical protein